MLKVKIVESQLTFEKSLGERKPKCLKIKAKIG
jgi:hypothetical protein